MFAQMQSTASDDLNRRHTAGSMVACLRGALGVHNVELPSELDEWSHRVVQSISDKGGRDQFSAAENDALSKALGTEYMDRVERLLTMFKTHVETTPN